MANKRQTSLKVAAKASKILTNPAAKPAVKSVAASALAQTRTPKKKK